MTDAPERIWCGPGYTDDGPCWTEGLWDLEKDGSDTEYIRADLHEALQAENARLRGYLRSARAFPKLAAAFAEEALTSRPLTDPAAQEGEDE